MKDIRVTFYIKPRRKNMCKIKVIREGRKVVPRLKRTARKAVRDTKKII